LQILYSRPSFVCARSMQWPGNLGKLNSTLFAPASKLTGRICVITELSTDAGAGRQLGSTCAGNGILSLSAASSYQLQIVACALCASSSYLPLTAFFYFSLPLFVFEHLRQPVCDEVASALTLRRSVSPSLSRTQRAPSPNWKY
jgi:hypothetical protein